MSAMQSAMHADYAASMTQFVTRIDDRLARAVDDLVESGVFESRSDAVRAGLDVVVDRERRRLIGEQINAGYERLPETEQALAAAEARGRAMILEEPW